MYFCTAADSGHYPVLLNMIGSLFKHNAQSIEGIAVFDLGLTASEINEIKKIDKVQVVEVEKIHPLIITPLHSDNSRWVKGLFSWKAVAIKQALEMFPYVLYLDAGTTILKPLDPLFKHILQNDYFITDCGHSIKWMTTKYIINKFRLNTSQTDWILRDSVLGIDAGFIGLTQKMYNQFILPLYELSKEIQNFVDDGTCPEGWGTARHDQTLFSILARQLDLTVLNHDREIEECILTYSDYKTPFHITHAAHKVREDTCIYRSRRNIDMNMLNHHISFLRKSSN
jgi:hypothetical protein